MHAGYRWLAAVAVNGRWLESRHVEVFQHAQRLRDRNAARRRRAHAAHPIGAVRRAHRVAFDRLIVRQIGHLGQARRDGEGGAATAGHLDFVDDVLRDGAGVERIGTGRRDGRQRDGVRRIFNHGAQRFCAAIRIQKIRRSFWVGLQIYSTASNCVGHATADRETIGCQHDARVEQVFPQQAAVILVRKLQHTHRAGCADRATALP